MGDLTKVNVASQELCKKLYKLSKWPAENWGWFYTWGDEPKNGDWHISQVHYSTDMNYGKYCVPAYGLDYLLRKLRTATFRPILKARAIGWSCEISHDGRSYHEFASDPEDAVCLLAILLFEEKVLDKRATSVKQ